MAGLFTRGNFMHLVGERVPAEKARFELSRRGLDWPNDEFGSVDHADRLVNAVYMAVSDSKSFRMA